MRRQSRLSRAVEAILRDRRPKRFPATTDEAAQLRFAAMLRSAHPGSDLPSAEFVDRLADQLRRQANQPEPSARPQLRAGRRAFLQASGVAAAAAAAGVGIDRAVVALRSSSLEQGPMNIPDAGGWTPVATLTAVRSTPGMRFKAGSVEGVLVAQPDGTVDALSAVCTHLGCLLNVDGANKRLTCPCHSATFTFDGTPNNSEYLRPLPRLQSRINGEHVEVFVA